MLVFICWKSKIFDTYNVHFFVDFWNLTANRGSYTVQFYYCILNFSCVFKIISKAYVSNSWVICRCLPKLLNCLMKILIWDSISKIALRKNCSIRDPLKLLLDTWNSSKFWYPTSFIPDLLGTQNFGINETDAYNSFVCES